MEAGGDRDLFIPLDDEGNLPMDSLDRTMGCHRGRFSVLNVHNAQQGFEYRYVQNKPQQILRARMEGSDLVRDGDPEYTGLCEGMEGSMGIDSRSIDTTQVYGDVVLVKTPIEEMRKVREAQAERAHQSLHGGARRYAERAPSDELEAAGQRGLSSLRFARGEHQLAHARGEDTTGIDRSAGIKQERRGS